MPKVLTDEQITFYRTNGYLVPFDGVSSSDAAAMCDDLSSFEREEGIRASEIIVKGHLCFRRSYEFSCHPKILDVVEDLIGPNIYALSSRFWIKPGRDGSYVSWHQDSAYFGLEPNELVTVWLALTDSTTENGCVRVIPGTHIGNTHSHVETFDEKNLLARGQSIEGIDDSSAVDLILRSGQFSCHHERIVHGSNPNETDHMRIGIGIFYFPAHVRSTIGRRPASLVRGVDEYGHWDADPVPKTNLDADVYAHVKAAGDRYVDPQYPQEALREGSVL
ncbi:MAG: phytanoyl-CoA dioxygenase family protein [Pseudomonadota bacterium]|nr:phytanoyl-CoA dioxygenase family protein [Pseudomonadota bacterium]